MCIITDSENDTLNLALVQNTFSFEEHEVKVAPHGNSVKSEGYVRTVSSVMSKLKDISSSNSAKHALSLLTSDITTAHSECLILLNVWCDKVCQKRFSRVAVLQSINIRRIK